MHISDMSLGGFISDGAGAAVAALRAWAMEWDLTATEEGNLLSIQICDGELRLIPEPDGARLVIRAPERRLVQVIREAASEFLDAEGITVQWDRTDSGELAPGLSLMHVASVTRPTPGYLRMRVTGPEASRFGTGGLHFRLLLPRPGQTPIWPRINAKGRTEWPEGRDALHRPVYTVSAQEADWLEFDIFRHDGSPTCDWALSDPLGQEVGIVGPGGGGCPDARSLYLFGDETALPAIRRILSLATGEARAFVRASDDDLAALSSDPRVVRVTDPAATLAGMPFPSGSHIWFAGRDDAARAVRADLSARGMAKRDFTSVAYWA